MNRRLVLLLLLLVLAACLPEEPAPPAEPALGEGLTAVATVFPLAWLADEIAPGAEVALLGARGQDPHDLELSPGDRGLLETADVVLYLGDIGFQPQVERAVEERTEPVVAVSEMAGEAGMRELDNGDDEHGHDDDHGRDDEHGSDGEQDPHMWFDPEIMADVVDAIAEAFAAADPDHGAAYVANAAQLRDELAVVADDIDALLSDCRLDTAIVSHEAYAYLLHPRGLEQEGISGAGGHAEVSPQRLAELTERIRADGIPGVLAEPVEGRADAEALAAEAGVDLLEIDPLEVVTVDQYERGYFVLLREQAEAFATALDCEPR